MLREKLKGRKESEYIEVIEYLLSDDISNRAVKAMETQLDHIISFFEKENIIEGVDDKDDKTFERTKSFLEKLPKLTIDLQNLKLSMLKLDDKKDIKQAAAKNSIISLINEQTSK
jgi:hypothetical protein